MSHQHSLTTLHDNKISKSHRHHSFQSHRSSKTNPQRKRVIHASIRTSKNSICPTNNGLSDYNSRLSSNITPIPGICQDRKTSIKSTVGQSSIESTRKIPYCGSIAKTNQNHGSLTQNEHSKEQKINTYEEYHHRKPTTNSKYSSRLTNTTSNTDISPFNFEDSENSHKTEKITAQSNRRKPVKKPDRKWRRRRRCLGGYCCPCSPLCTFLSLLALLLLAAAIAALIIALIKPKSTTTSATAITVPSTTTTSITITTTSSTSTTTISSTSTPTTSSTSTPTTSSTSTTTTSSTSTTTTSSTSIATTSSASTATTSSTSTTTTSSTSTTTATSTTKIVTTTTSTSTSSATTTPRPMCRITRAGDLIKGLYNTTAGRSTGGFEGRYSSASESPDEAIDNKTNTKYLNYGPYGTMNLILPQPGAGTGFYVTPTISSATVANALLFATGNDYPERDPLTATLEGTNSTALNASSSWTLIHNGSTGINAISAPSRSTYGALAVFSNTIAYRSYRLLITSQRAPQDSIQYSESHVMTYC